MLHAMLCKILGFSEKASKLYLKLEKFIHQA